MLICISNIFHVRQTYPCFFDHTVERQVLLKENIGEERLENSILVLVY